MTFRFVDHARHIDRLIAAALRACEPASCVREAIRRDASLAPPGAAVLAVGKAAPAMLRGYIEAAGEPAQRLLLTTPGHDAPPWALIGDHPIPMARNVAHAAAVEAFITRLRAPALVVLLSGGASALLAAPAPGVNLSDLAAVSRALLEAGATIHELNTVRKHLERLKGGRLASLARGRTIVVLVLSDVVDNRLDVIGSGPCAPDHSTYADALRVLAQHSISARFPAITAFLREGARGQHGETPKSGDPAFDRVHHHIVADNASAIRAAAHEAASFGAVSVESQSGITGEARRVAVRLTDQAARHARDGVAGCIVFGGETTVNLGDAAGRGGRNQELALAAAIELDRVHRAAPRIAIAAFATDGVDGPTDAAGAAVTDDTCTRARALQLDPQDYLNRHDSTSFFQRVGGLITTGPTGTNVCDIMLALVYGPT